MHADYYCRGGNSFPSSFDFGGKRSKATISQGFITQCTHALSLIFDLVRSTSSMAEEASVPDLAQPQASVEATIASNAQGGAESSCNNATAESSAVTCDVDREKSLEFSEELMERGANAAKECDYAEAADCYSRALEIRVAHYGELAPECVNTYYKYGCVLLYKAQEEADPLGAVPKKDGESQQISSDKDGFLNNGTNGESSIASVSSNTEQGGSSQAPEVFPENASGVMGQEDDDDESDAEELAEAEEDESDLDLAWKMLDLARAILEKSPGDTMEKVDVLSTLAEVALEREDVETSLSDYMKALAILERLVEVDSRRIAELNFRICLCLEIGAKPQEAIPYCQKAISICKARVQRLTKEVKSSKESTALASSKLDPTVELSSSGSLSNDDAMEKEAEIETLTELSSELEKKLEDLQQLVSNPRSILSDILEMMSAKAKYSGKNASSVMSSSQLGASGSGDVDSPTVSSAHTNGAAAVTHLGVVGRGVKRVVMSGTAAAEPRPMKKLESDPSVAEDGDKGSK